MTKPAVSPTVRQPGRRPFGLYAIMALLLLTVGVAVLHIIRLRSGLDNRYLLQLLEVVGESASLTTLPALFFDDPIVLTVIDGVVILFVLATVVGLWFRARWAWVLAMLIIGIGLAFNIWRYLEGRPLFPSMAIHVLAVFYLNERTVRSVFEPPPTEGGPPGVTAR